MPAERFAKALQEGLESRNLADALKGLDKAVGVEQATALAAILPELEPWDENWLRSPVGVVATLLQGCDDEEARTLLGQALPDVHALYDRALEALRGGTTPNTRSGDLVFLLKVYALYASQGGLARVVAAARDPLLCDDWLWSVVMNVYTPDHPLTEALVEGLRAPLPNGFAAVAFLDLCNTLARAGRLPEHPFATREGIAQLKKWLAAKDPEKFSFAHSATAALPYVGAARAKLLPTAFAHPDRAVRMEAAWAVATLGDDEGIRRLTAAALEVPTAQVAAAYLRELGRQDAIPPAAREPDFLAAAEASHWLEHPNELGRVPEGLALYDTREIAWPPTRDRRRVWLFRFDHDDGPRVVMVGSVTFCLLGAGAGLLPPEDVYALHCCWELKNADDPRAPSESSVEAGRALLGL